MFLSYVKYKTNIESIFFLKIVFSRLAYRFFSLFIVFVFATIKQINEKVKRTE